MIPGREYGSTTRLNEPERSSDANDGSPEAERRLKSRAPRRGKISQSLQNKEILGRLETREMGKILPEGLGDVQEAIDMGYYMAGEGRRLSGETVPSELPNKDMKSVRVPIGVFGLITPWNFPIAIPAWKIFPALICGNTVIFKPSSETSVCAAKFVEIFEQAGLPRGVLNLVHGPGADVGEYLVSHPGVDAISFTGSFDVGRRWADLRLDPASYRYRNGRKEYHHCHGRCAS